jgi:hypothetical protein
MALKIEGKKFSRLLALGPERLKAVNNKLAQGVSCNTVARLIQQDWKEFTDVAEKTLSIQLQRYKTDVVAVTSQNYDEQTVLVTTVVGRVNVVKEMAELMQMQKNRIKDAVDKEKQLKGMLLKGVNTEIETLQAILKDIQKVQFDLGIDDFKGVITQNGKIMSANVTLPDGTTMNMQVMDAQQEALKIIEEYEPRGSDVTDVESR